MICFLVILVLLTSRPCLAYETSLKVKIVDVVEEKEMDFGGVKQNYQMLEGVIVDGDKNVGETIYIENGQYLGTNIKTFKTDDVVYVSHFVDQEENDNFVIVDFVRTDVLIKVFVIFVVVTVLVAGGKGLSSIIAMGLSFGVVFKLILPGILAGKNPILLVITGSSLIIPITFYLSHGFSKKTTIAIAGTIVSMIITTIMALVFINMAKLSGLVSDEANFVVTEIDSVINLKNLLLAGIIVGALGVFDDVTVSQASIVEELKRTDSALNSKELFDKAMRVGKDHIASMVNTLILVYAGASLPLLLLFLNNPHPFEEVINLEIVAEEIIKTLVGSIGLVLAVPITTYLAVLFFNKTTDCKTDKNTKAAN